MIKFATVWVLTVIVSYSGSYNSKAITSFQHTYSSRDECIKQSSFYRKHNDGIKYYETYCVPSQIPMVIPK